MGKKRAFTLTTSRARCLGHSVFLARAQEMATQVDPHRRHSQASRKMAFESGKTMRSF